MSRSRAAGWVPVLNTLSCVSLWIQDISLFVHFTPAMDVVSSLSLARQSHTNPDSLAKECSTNSSPAWSFLRILVPTKERWQPLKISVWKPARCFEIILLLLHRKKKGKHTNKQKIYNLQNVNLVLIFWNKYFGPHLFMSFKEIPSCIQLKIVRLTKSHNAGSWL